MNGSILTGNTVSLFRYYASSQEELISCSHADALQRYVLNPWSDSVPFQKTWSLDGRFNNFIKENWDLA